MDGGSSRQRKSRWYDTTIWYKVAQGHIFTMPIYRTLPCICILTVYIRYYVRTLIFDLHGSINVSAWDNASHQYPEMLYFYLKMHQNARGGRSLPEPAIGELTTLPSPLAGLKRRDVETQRDGNKGKRGRKEEGPQCLKCVDASASVQDEAPGQQHCFASHPTTVSSSTHYRGTVVIEP